MAIMIPEKPINVPVGSREDEMFIALTGLSDEYYVFYSFVLISNTEGILRESETDFVIFHPQKGIICLEAKAGHVFCRQGIWYYNDGQRMKHDGPYEQARMNKWKLKKYFDEKDMTDVWKRCKTLHAVWFPSVNKSELNGIQFPADGDKSITLTEESLDNIERDIDRIFALELPSKVETTITKAEAKRILDNVLCPSFDLVPSMISELSIKQNAFNRLLKEQANILNFLEDQPFAVINGAAGTGKTMIALEKARRHSEAGERVLFLCFNRFLRDYCKTNYAHSNIVYNTIDGFACSYCSTESADYSLLQEKLETAYYEGSFPFKHVIIDEGQDFGQDRIEEAEIIKLLETIVLSEEIGGSFYLFYDKNQLVQGHRMPKYIADSDCKLTLYRNCRNTENIAKTSMRPLGITSKPKMFSGCIVGEPPKVFVAETADKHKVYLETALKQLSDKKIKDVVILTCKTEGTSALSQFCSDGQYHWNGKSYRFTTCRKFKGLEADAIVLIDVDKRMLNGDESFNFYVGASRARFFLSVICQMSDEDCVEALRAIGSAPENKKTPKKALASALNALLTS